MVYGVWVMFRLRTEFHIQNKKLGVIMSLHREMKFGEECILRREGIKLSVSKLTESYDKVLLSIVDGDNTTDHEVTVGEWSEFPEVGVKVTTRGSNKNKWVYLYVDPANTIHKD